MNNIFDGLELPSQPMKKGKSKSWLGEYHWVSLPFPDPEDKNSEALIWCNENFGKSGHRWFQNEKKFYFKDEKDMSIFILRWS